MKVDQPSRTALVVARLRAAHQLLDRGAILSDPYALAILGEEEDEVVRFASTPPMPGFGRLLTVARSRIAEDALARAVASGTKQIVVLGAGLDTFPLRNPHVEQGVSVFEVDHPATQLWKRQRMTQAQLEAPSRHAFVSVDFEHESLGEKLSAAGFQHDSPAFFTWLGVVPYLTLEAIGETLDYIILIPGAEVVFDYLEKDEAFSEAERANVSGRDARLENMDERWTSRFDREGMASVLRDHGFYGIEDFDFERLASMFGERIRGLAPGQGGIHVVHASC